MEQFYDVCDKCSSRELDFVFFDLKRDGNQMWIKDIPGYRCRECGEVLLSCGVIDTVDEVIAKPTGSSVFPLLKYQRRVVKNSSLARDINERLLHAWSYIRCDGRESWSLMGFRAFGDLKTLSAI